MAVPELFNSGLRAGEVAELVNLYAPAVARFRQMVLHPPGGTAASRAFRLARAAQLTVQIDRILAGLGAGVAAWVGHNLPKALAAGVNLADRQAVAAGTRIPGSPVVDSFALVDRGTVRQFTRDIVQPVAFAQLTTIAVANTSAADPRDPSKTVQLELYYGDLVEPVGPGGLLAKHEPAGLPAANLQVAVHNTGTGPVDYSLLLAGWAPPAKSTD